MYLEHFFQYPEAMVNIDEETRERLAIAKRIDEAISSMPRGTKRVIATKCGVDPAAVTGWLKTGRINKANIAVISAITGYSLSWLITGNGKKFSKVKDDSSAISPLLTNHEQELGREDYDSNGEEGPGLGRFRKVPVVGTAQLGDDGYWSEIEYPVGFGDGYIEYPTSDPNAYAIRCKGDSMKPRIREGEFVIVEPNLEAFPGDDVLVKAKDGRVMVKTFLYIRDNRVHLMSINEAHPPQSIALEDIEKMHPVVATARKAAWVRA